MAINGMSLMEGASGISITGGSAVTWKTDGTDVPNGVRAVDTSETDLTIRPYAIFKTRNPSYTNGNLIKGYREITHVRPKVLTDETIVLPLGRAKIEFCHETTAAEYLELKLQLCQMIMDSDLDDFHDYGNPS
jgi:hypothetical protein